MFTWNRKIIYYVSFKEILSVFHPREENMNTKEANNNNMNIQITEIKKIQNIL